MSINRQKRSGLGASGLRMPLAALAVGTLAATGVMLPAAADGPAEEFEEFSDPSMGDRPFYRYWHGGGAMDSEVIENDLDAMIEIGAGGLEASNYIGSDDPGYDPEQYEWGLPLWSQRLTELFTAGKERGMQVDTLYTPSWSAGTTTVSPDGPGSAKEITFAHEVVEPGAKFSGDLPESELPEGVAERELIAVLAYECAENCDGEELPTLNQDSVTDLTQEADPEAPLEWQAPEGEQQWVIVTAWMNGTGQEIGRGGMSETQYMVDHFDRSGFESVREYWEDNVLTPELREALGESGGSLFFDSIEVNRAGTQIRNWTPNFLEEFEERRGYSLVPYLPVVGVVEQPEADPDLPEWAAPVPLPDYEFSDPGLADRIRQDYSSTVSELFLEEHVRPVMEWAHDLGLTVRGQGYSSWGPTSIDVQTIYRELDIAEGESRSFGAPPFSTPPFIDVRANDAWRAMASAVASVDKNIVSTECCASGQAWEVPRQTLLSYINQQFSVGVNQIVYHGWSHKSPVISPSWPGWEGMRQGVADSYGPHMAQFTHDRMINDYVARNQHVLRSGELRTDVAIYREGAGHSIEGLSGSPYWEDESLFQAGYTYGFLNAEIVTDPDIELENGRLDAEGPQYGALIVNGTENMQNYSTMALESAEQIDAWAAQGLPIVVVGDVPTQVTGYAEDDDEKLAEVFARLLDRENVRAVASEQDAPDALRDLGVDPAADFEEPAPIQMQRRETSDANYYFMWNSNAETETTTVTLSGSGEPFEFNAWTGEITEAASAERIDDNHVQVDVSLAAADATIIALADPEEVGVVNLPAAEVAGEESEQHTLDSWTVDVTSYEEGDAPTVTDHVDLGEFEVPVVGEKLATWDEIEGLESISGIGNYTTEIDIDEWSDGANAVLHLGDLFGTYRVSVNGEQLPPHSQLDTSDISVASYLQEGTNVIEVEVATLMENAMRDKGQVYGLAGPVTLEVDPGAEDPGEDPTDEPDEGEDETPEETDDPNEDGEDSDGEDESPGADDADDSGDDLAITGTQIMGLAIAAVLLLGAGALLMFRRRRTGMGN